MHYIADTDVPLIFTAGLDRMAYIWDLGDEERKEPGLRGKLLQGYMLKPDYRWEFPLKNFFSKDAHNNRRKGAEEKLKKIRVGRAENDRQYKNLAYEASQKMEKTNMRSSLGFAGDDLRSLLGVEDDHGNY